MKRRLRLFCGLDNLSEYTRAHYQYRIEITFQALCFFILQTVFSHLVKKYSALMWLILAKSPQRFKDMAGLLFDELTKTLNLLEVVQGERVLEAWM